MYVNLIHNPTAGFDGHNGEDLVQMIHQAGYEVKYISSKEDDIKKEFKNKHDIIAVAGGDGTVGKILKRIPDTDVPIGLLPMGTANNISKTLGVTASPAALADSWKDAKRKQVSLGIAKGPEGKTRFLESVGFGLFTNLMKVMAEKEDSLEFDEKQEELDYATKLMQKILQDYKPQYCEVFIDGKEFSGDYLLVEIMNIPFIGPNLQLAPGANPSDGYFDVVFIEESDREIFNHYLERKLKREETNLKLRTVQGKKIRLNGKLSELHIDDEEIEGKGSGKFEVAMEEKKLVFLVG